MNGVPDPTSVNSNRIDLANQIDIVCDDFEKSWRSGVEPSICEVVESFDPRGRDWLATELLLLDCELRRARGERVTRDDYLTRYPELTTAIERVDFSTIGSQPERRYTYSADVPGGRFGQFELIERIGAGASGAVWKARDTTLRRLVALKLPHLQDMSAAERARFRREGQASAQLHHPNIVSVYQVGEEDRRCYIASELIEGWTLRQWLDEHKRLSHVEAVSLTAQLAEALQHAHEQGVIHRDLKPANVLIDKAGVPHVTDFGLARWTDQSVALTMDGHVVGTPAYMSPEQARGDTVAADRQADVYSLGAMFYEMIAGRPPFDGELASVIHQVINVEPASPRRVDVRVPRDLETISLKAIQKVPADRYASMQDLAEDLRRYLRGEPISARPLGPVARTVRFVKRHKPLVGMVAACLLAVCALGIVFVLMEKNYRLQGYRTVSITTDPPGARMAFVPLSTETGEPELYRKVLAPGVSPVTVDLLPGDYFVVAVLADGRFHEVYRRVPRNNEQDKSGASCFTFWPRDDGSVLLQRISIPMETVSRGMIHIEGNPAFPFGMRPSDESVPYVHPIRPFYIDEHEFTVRDYQNVYDTARAHSSQRVTLPGKVAHYTNFATAVANAEKLGKRLPTEAEYEYLATNGGTTRYPWGDDWPAAAATIPSDQTGDPFGPVGTPEFDRVARYPAVVGLCSNKAEWVMPQRLPKVLDRGVRHEIVLSAARVYRGGSAATIAGDPRVTPEDRDPTRRGEAPDKREHPGLGFRCVRSAEPLVSYDDFK